MAKVIDLFTKETIKEPAPDDFVLVQEELVQMAKEIGHYVGIMDETDTKVIKKLLQEMDAKAYSIASQRQHLQKFIQAAKKLLEKEEANLTDITGAYSTAMYDILNSLGVNTDTQGFESNIIVTGLDGHLWIVKSKDYENYVLKNTK
jgi:hypothetical protein